MGLLKQLKADDNAVQQGDRLGGFETFPTDVYDGVIKVAYINPSKGESKTVGITVLADFGGKEYRETFYVTNSEGKTSFPDKNDPKTIRVMSGWTVINDLCLFTNEISIDEQEEAEKIVKIYDYDKKADVNTPVTTIAALQGAPIKAAIFRRIEMKQERNADGKYVDTDKTRTINAIEKIFNPDDGRTVTECMNGVDKPEFLTAWLERNKGKDQDRTKKSNGAAGASGAGTPGASGSGSPARTALFGKK